MLVNGTVVVRTSEIITSVSPGQPIRYRMEETGRWVPLEKESYLDELPRPEFTPDLGVGTQ